jgi:hypothetical protein
MSRKWLSAEDANSVHHPVGSAAPFLRLHSVQICFVFRAQVIPIAVDPVVDQSFSFCIWRRVRMSGASECLRVSPKIMDLLQYFHVVTRCLSFFSNLVEVI